jgi:hypothetical protein
MRVRPPPSAPGDSTAKPKTTPKGDALRGRIRVERSDSSDGQSSDGRLLIADAEDPSVRAAPPEAARSWPIDRTRRKDRPVRPAAAVRPSMEADATAACDLNHGGGRRIGHARRRKRRCRGRRDAKKGGESRRCYNRSHIYPCRKVPQNSGRRAAPRERPKLRLVASALAAPLKHDSTKLVDLRNETILLDKNM